MEQNIQDKKFLKIFVDGSSHLGFKFSSETLEKFLSHYRELCQWEKLLNLTSMKEEKEKIVLLFLDSLAGSFAFESKEDLDVIDIGSGGGFPGIPIKIAFPSINLCLAEAKAKKAAFLINILGKLDLRNVTLIQERLENFQQLKWKEKKWDMAMIKAVNVSQVIPHMNKILNENGKLVVFRSKKFANHAIINGMEVYREIEYELPFGFGKRVISVLKFFKKPEL